MIYVPIFVNIVLLLLFDYICLSFSIVSFGYLFERAFELFLTCTVGA